MPGRTFNSSSYRYGFNGKENDPETHKGTLDFGGRIYDSRIGRWMSIDPDQYDFPNYSPYNFCLNNPIDLTDPNGESPISKAVLKAAKKIVTAIAKQMAPELAEMVLKQSLKKGLKSYAGKGFVKRFTKDLTETISAVYDESWIETTIGLIPAVGDVFDIGNLIRKGFKNQDRMLAVLTNFQKAAIRIEGALTNSRAKLLK